MSKKLLEGNLYLKNFEQFSDYIALAKSTSYVPKNFEIEGVQDNIKQNGDDVIRLRFGRNGKTSGFYDEHFSITIRKSDNLILGFVDLRQENSISSEEIAQLPKENEMPELVKNFFDSWDSDYLNELDDYAYRSPYGENILVDGVELAIAGTEWKWYAPATRDWGWIVFGKNRNPIIFERNIRWVTGRTTEKWLHDRYLESGNLTFVPVTVK
jgi:hypothetical protein